LTGICVFDLKVRAEIIIMNKVSGKDGKPDQENQDV
jgi:hypothetical protein